MVMCRDDRVLPGCSGAGRRRRSARIAIEMAARCAVRRLFRRRGQGLLPRRRARRDDPAGRAGHQPVAGSRLGRRRCRGRLAGLGPRGARSRCAGRQHRADLPAFRAAIDLPSRQRRPADLKGKTLAVWFAGNEFPFLAWMAKVGLTTGGDKPDVTVLRQGAGVELLVERRAACISTMSYNEYWQVIDAGMKPSQLVVFRYDDEGVATLEDGLYALATKLADPAMRDLMARFLRASVAGWRFA